MWCEFESTPMPAIDQSTCSKNHYEMQSGNLLQYIDKAKCAVGNLRKPISSSGAAVGFEHSRHSATTSANVSAHPSN